MGDSEEDIPQPPRTIPNDGASPADVRKEYKSRTSFVFPGVPLPEIDWKNLEEVTTNALIYWQRKSKIPITAELEERCRKFFQDAIISGRVLRQALIEAGSGFLFTMKDSESATSHAYYEIGQAILRSAYIDERDILARKQASLREAARLEQSEELKARAKYVSQKSREVLKDWERQNSLVELKEKGATP